MKSSQFFRYQTTADTIRQRIADSAYPLRSRLPSEETLSKELGVSRPTVKSAVRMLEEEGLIECRPAVGSFVVRRPGEGFFIGYIAPDLHDPFQAEVIGELDKMARNINGSLAVSESGLTLDDERSAIARLTERGVKGIFLSRAIGVCDERLPASEVPIVFVGGVPSRGHFTGVTIDNAEGIFALVDHLVSRGCRTIAYAGAGVQHPEDDPRHAALLSCAAAKGIHVPPQMQCFDYLPGLEGGRAIMRRLLAGPLPDAVVCFNDWTALGVIREAVAGGVNVPDKLKVTGFDNILISRYVQIPITTIDYRIPAYVQAAFGMLQQRLKPGAPPPAQKRLALIKGELIVRESA